MARLASCPNCGAPLRASEASATDCPYCGCRIVLEPKPVPVVRPTPVAQAAMTPLIIAVAGVVVLVGIGSALAFLRAPAVSAQPAAARAPLVAATTAAKGRPSVALSRLGAIDVGLQTDAAKVAMPRDFPEAEPDMHQIEYRFRLDHPAFQEAVVVWEWGCRCLSHVHVRFRDFPTRQRAPQSFVPCIGKRLAPPSKAQEPFSYEWDRGGNLPELRLSQELRIDLRAGGGQQAWQDMLGAVDACGRELAAAAASPP